MSPARPAERRERGAAQPGVAIVQRKGRFWTASPLFERGRRVTLDGRSRNDAGPGDMVLLGWGKRGARVARVIGRPDVARHVLEALMLERGLRRVFPRGVEVEARATAADPPWDGGRQNLTELATFTIDPVTARDYDDAVSAKRERGGVIRVWVHIADVSAYVRPGSALGDEALRRATSVYVPGAVEAMLPGALSSDACSLVPGEPRNAVTVELEMAGAEVRSASFHRSLIRSDARLTYAQVDRIYAGSERAEEPWAEPLALAREVSRVLAGKRAERAAIEVESTEPVFEFDDAGNVTGVHAEQHTESHRTIEHLMILANEAVAGYLADRRLPTLYRVHERPDPQAILYLADQLESLEVPTPPIPKHMSPQEAADLAGEISREIAQYVRTSGRREAFGSLVLRSLKQAIYSPRNVGHAGLASPRYCHFTSPIRRYPDLVAHRALLAGLGADDVAPRADELEEVALHSSTAEREAMRVERDADDVCLALLLERHLYEHGPELEFEGEVVGLVGAGAFVRFGEERFEGFLPVRRLRGDWWDLNELGTALVGAESGRELRLGDAVRVAVGRVTPARGRVDLEPA